MREGLAEPAGTAWAGARVGRPEFEREESIPESPVNLDKTRSHHIFITADAGGAKLRLEGDFAFKSHHAFLGQDLDLNHTGPVSVFARLF